MGKPVALMTGNPKGIRRCKMGGTGFGAHASCPIIRKEIFSKYSDPRLGTIPALVFFQKWRTNRRLGVGGDHGCSDIPSTVTHS